MCGQAPTRVGTMPTMLGQPAEWTRCILASMIDGAVVYLVTMFAAVRALDQWSPGQSLSPDRQFAIGWLGLAAIATGVAWLYAGALGQRGWCLGHLLCRTRVTRVGSSERLPGWRGALRAMPLQLPLLVSFALTPVVGWGVVYAMFSLVALSAVVTWSSVFLDKKDSRGWHDRLAGAAVVRR